MHTHTLRTLGRRLWPAVLVLCLLAACAPGGGSGPAPGLRAVWVHPGQIDSPEEVEATLARLEKGGFTTVLPLVWHEGQAFYESALLPLHPQVATGFNPLATLIAGAHERGIAVHAWLEVGRQCSQGEMGPLLVDHPEWALVGADGRRTCWLNFVRPEVRAFVGDVVLELVTEVGVDGVHLDYTRYPGPEWGYDDVSAGLLAEAEGLDLNELRYAELPAYGPVSSNPLLWPATAEVLAEFDDGQPAVLRNQYGAGTVLLLNWEAQRREVAAGSEILERGIDSLVEEGGRVRVLRSETTIQEYGDEAFEQTLTWLEELGWQPAEIAELDLPLLEPEDVLVLPGVYRIKGVVARELADFVERGGGAVFVDGPTPSIWNSDVRAVTGMRFRGKSSSGMRVLSATQEHELLPRSDRSLSFAEYAARDEQWKQFRRDTINRLIEELHARLQQEAPQVQLSITVAPDQEALAERVLLDWRAWLEAGTVDLLIPRAYVTERGSLEKPLGEWQEVMAGSDRIVVGLSASAGGPERGRAKAPRRLVQEMEQVVDWGSQGVVLFHLDWMNDEQLEALANGPFAPVQPGGE